MTEEKSINDDKVSSSEGREYDSVLTYQTITTLLDQADSVVEKNVYYKNGDSSTVVQEYKVPSYIHFGGKVDYSRTNLEPRFQVGGLFSHLISKSKYKTNNGVDIILDKWNQPAGYIGLPDSNMVLQFSFNDQGNAHFENPGIKGPVQIIIIDRINGRYQFAIINKDLAVENQLRIVTKQIGQEDLGKELNRVLKKNNSH